MENMKMTPAEWREFRGKSYADCAKAVGVDYRTWKEYEEHPSNIPIGKAYAFCTWLGISPDAVSFFP